MNGPKWGVRLYEETLAEGAMLQMAGAIRPVRR